MYELSAESVHALRPGEAPQAGIRSGPPGMARLLLGCGALKELDGKHGEVKSMRTPAALAARARTSDPRHIIEVPGLDPTSA